jgi:transposase-like protein
MSGTKGMPHYPLEMKQEAIRLREESGLSHAQIAEQLGIRKGGRKEAWYRAYRQEGELAFHRPIGRPRKDQAEQATIEQLSMENALLKELHTELRRAMLVRRNIGY